MAIYASAARHGTTRAETLVRMAVGALGRSAFAVLVAFHAWLLWTHLAAGQAFEPGAAIRWLVAVGVLVGFRALSRLGLPLLSGRRAVVLWLLVILIHCHAVWTGDVVTADLGVPETLHAFSQLTGSISVLGTLIVTLVAAQAVHAAAVVDLRRTRPAPALVAGFPSDGFTFRFTPRPPPLA
jgi:hypothetical protein